MIISYKEDLAARLFGGGFRLDPKLALHTNCDAKLAHSFCTPTIALHWQQPKHHKHFSEKQREVPTSHSHVLVLSVIRVRKLSFLNPMPPILAITAALSSTGRILN
jgi:hypothetical protein